MKYFIYIYIHTHTHLKVYISVLFFSCQIVCDSRDCSPPVSSVHWISQAGILEWVAISFSRKSSQPRDRTQVFCIAGPDSLLLSHQGSLHVSIHSLISFHIFHLCVNSLPGPEQSMPSISEASPATSFYSL